MRPDATRDEGLRELGVHGRLRKIAYLPSGQAREHCARNQLLEEYKAELKKEKHRLALELHPDTNVGEEEEVIASRSKRLQRALRAIDFVMTLNAQPPPRARPRGIVMVVYGVRSGVGGFGGMPFGGNSATATSTSTTTNPWGGIVR